MELLFGLGLLAAVFAAFVVLSLVAWVVKVAFHVALIPLALIGVVIKATLAIVAVVVIAVVGIPLLAVGAVLLLPLLAIAAVVGLGAMAFGAVF